MPSKRKTPAVSTNSWGGRRAGAGRKPNGPIAGVSHGPRPPHDKRYPVLVTLRVGRDLPSLRRAATRSAILETLPETQKRDFRVVHYAIEARRLLFLVEAGSRVALTSGCQGLSVRVARALNRVL